MIISRTPYRISFFGGGTDYPAWYRAFGGAVVSTTIDKYCYISCRYLPPFFEHKSRIVYSKIESVRDTQEIQHPAVRETLKYLNVSEGVEIHHDGDLPARTGLGSSSAFTVGLLHALFALKRRMPSKRELAEEAIHVERNILGEHVGSQDQFAVAHGGLNVISFLQQDAIQVKPVIIDAERLREFQSHLMLYFTGFSRYASEIAESQIQNIPRKKSELSAMYEMVEESVSLLTGNSDLEAFGKLLDRSWRLKKTLTDQISTSSIDQIYAAALSAGATGGKLLGAGGGGFMLLFVKPELQNRVKEKLNGLLHVPIQFESHGSQIIFYEPSAFDRDFYRLKDRHTADQEELVCLDMKPTS